MSDLPVTPRTKPTGQVIHYPECGDWSCDDDYDWDWVRSSDPEYPSIKREHDIATYHEPRDRWRQRLSEERKRLKGDPGKPLWHTY